jgi:hypothetical protein
MSYNPVNMDYTPPSLSLPILPLISSPAKEKAKKKQKKKQKSKKAKKKHPYVKRKIIDKRHPDLGSWAMLRRCEVYSSSPSLIITSSTYLESSNFILTTFLIEYPSRDGVESDTVCR